MEFVLEPGARLGPFVGMDQVVKMPAEQLIRRAMEIKPDDSDVELAAFRV